MGTLNLLLSARSQLPHPQVNNILLFCWCQEASLLRGDGDPALTTKPSHGKAPTAQSKSKNPALLLSGNLPLCECQETYFPNEQKGPSTIPNHKRAPASPLNSENTRFSSEGRKAVTCYSVGSTRRPSSQSAQRPSSPQCT
jgi:hypothetical protein